MMKKKQILIIVLLVVILLAFNKIFMQALRTTNQKVDTSQIVNNEKVSPQRLFDKSWKLVKNEYFDQSLNKQDWARWKRHYKGQIKTDEDAKIAIGSMLASLDDPYSRFLDKKDFNSQRSNIDSHIYGIGVNISSVSGKTVVVGVIEGSPASLAKLTTGDVITSVNGEDVNGMPLHEVADKVQGPENSIVQIGLLRDGQKLTKKIKRKEIKIKTVKYNQDKDIGYIQITSFIGKTTANEFLEALQKIQKSKGLIIDLRGNTGGLLPNAVFIANLFINDGNIVSMVGRNGYRQDIKAQDVGSQINVPIIVLVDGGSASASEILSGALQDHHKAKLLGTTTFGKGLVQKIEPMPNSTGMNITVAKYLTPAGHDIHKKGIKPDINLPLTKYDVIKKNDNQLAQAKILMTKMIADQQKAYAAQAKAQVKEQTTLNANANK